MKTVKAKIIKVDTGFIVVIYLCGRWRTFGTPYSPKGGKFVPHMKKKSAIKAANGMAKALSVTLDWEVSG